MGSHSLNLMVIFPDHSLNYLKTARLSVSRETLQDCIVLNSANKHTEQVQFEDPAGLVL